MTCELAAQRAAYPQAAERVTKLGSERTVRDRWKEWGLQAYRIGKHLRWKERDVYAWIERQSMTYEVYPSRPTSVLTVSKLG